MAKITRISETTIQYVCTCGRTVTLELPPDEKLKKLIKCFKCTKNEGISHEQAAKMFDDDNKPVKICLKEKTHEKTEKTYNLFCL